MSFELTRSVRTALIAGSLIGIPGTITGQELSKNPLIDAEQAFQVARQASEAGDFQAAIIALERLLVISPGLPNIQFELGLLYKRVGATRRAEFFLRESLKSDDMPENIRQRAEQELNSLTTLSQVGDFVFNTGIGLQYESNPVLESRRKEFFDPVSSTYVAGESIEQRDADGSLQASFGGVYSRRFGSDSRHSWQTGLSFRTSGYFEQTELNTSDIRLDGSLSYSLNPSISSPRENITPYFFYNLGFGQSDVEDNELGIGTAFSSSTELKSFRTSIEASTTKYDDSTRANSSDFNRVAAGLSVARRFSDTSRITYGLSINLASLDAKANSQSYTDTNARLSASYALKNIPSAPQAAAIFYLGSRLRKYDALNLQISDTEIRRDTSPEIGLSVIVPFSSGFSVSARLNTVKNQSNLANYRYRSTTASVGLNWRF